MDDSVKVPPYFNPDDHRWGRVIDDVAGNVEVDTDHEWGREHRLVNTPLYCAKFLEYVNTKPGSLHYHKEKDETFMVLEGEVYITRLYRPGEEINIPPDTEHQVQSKTEYAVLLEVSTHHEDSDTYRIGKAKKKHFEQSLFKACPVFEDEFPDGPCGPRVEVEQNGQTEKSDIPG